MPYGRRYSRYRRGRIVRRRSMRPWRMRRRTYRRRPLRRLARTVRAIRNRMDMTPSKVWLRDDAATFNQWSIGGKEIEGVVISPFRDVAIAAPSQLTSPPEYAAVRKDMSIRAMSGFLNIRVNMINEDSENTPFTGWIRVCVFRWMDDSIPTQDPASVFGLLFNFLNTVDGSLDLVTRNPDEYQRIRLISNKLYPIKPRNYGFQNGYIVPPADATYTVPAHVTRSNAQKLIRRKVKWKGKVQYTNGADAANRMWYGHYFVAIFTQKTDYSEFAERCTLTNNSWFQYSDM